MFFESEYAIIHKFRAMRIIRSDAGDDCILAKDGFLRIIPKNIVIHRKRPIFESSNIDYQYIIFAKSDGDLFVRRNNFRHSPRIKKARRIGSADSRAARRIAPPGQ